jgi:hypothetical protein
MPLVRIRRIGRSRMVKRSGSDAREARDRDYDMDRMRLDLEILYSIGAPAS